MTMKTIGLISRSPAPQLDSQLTVIGEAMGVRFVQPGSSSGETIDAWLHLDATEASLAEAAGKDAPAFLVLSRELGVSCGASDRVAISASRPAPFPFAGRTLQCGEVAALQALPAWASALQPVGSKEGLPFWSVKPAATHPGIWLTSAPLEPLKDGDSLFDHFNADRLVALLPLLCFLREVTGAGEWQTPGLHACFQFDDPNLHSVRYGYIDFPELAAHARQHRYHVSSATIPIDAWFVHSPAARLFRESADVLSLLVHGNDHIHEELGRHVPDAEREHTIRTALRRITSLEQRSGVRVSRSMAPPHGACSGEMLGTMGRLGFESACISRGSLRHYNRGAAWTRTIGMRPVDVIQGLPVLSRFRVSRQCQNSILLAAFLDQPIIPVGHHQDVADGLGIFSELAGFINGLGNVRWTDLHDMVRGMYATRREGSTLHVRLDARHADVAIPAGVDQVQIHLGWSNDFGAERLTVRSDEKTAARSFALSAVPVVPVSAQQPRLSLSVESPAGAGDRSAETRKSRLALWPIARRLLTEGRDRLSPAYRKLRTN